MTFFSINIYFIGILTDVEHLHWVQTLKDAHMAIDANLQWECKAIGKPRPTYKWMKNGQLLIAEVRHHNTEKMMLDSPFTHKNINRSKM